MSLSSEAQLVHITLTGHIADVGDDDILDAFAALWSAERMLRGESRSLPEHPPTDGCGLRMEIAY